MHFALYGRRLGAAVTGQMKELLDRLSAKKGLLSCYTDLYETLRSCNMEGAVNGAVYTSFDDMPSGVDAILAIGGDGTFLSSLTIVRDSGIPVAGINFGRLGFLASARRDNLQCGKLDDLFEGRFAVEKRSLLHLYGENLPDDFYPYALNEIALQRFGPNMLGIDVSLDGMKIPTYWADGLLVATPTGSTAYSLSVGGPVVVPGSSVFILAPVAPHNLNVRPLIVPDDVTVEISVRSENANVLLTADNRSVTLSGGVRFSVKKADFEIGRVSFGKETFFEALNEKLLWGEDRRNDINLNENNV